MTIKLFVPFTDAPNLGLVETLDIPDFITGPPAVIIWGARTFTPSRDRVITDDYWPYDEVHAYYVPLTSNQSATPPAPASES